MRRLVLAWALHLLLVCTPAHAETAVIAVAANFAETAGALEARFHAATGNRHELKFTVGATGSLYAQIVHGAPFHVLLAADGLRPARLEAEGLAVSGSRFTYAAGQLVLWTPRPGLELDADSLLDPAVRTIAMANPRTAPYGTAAESTLRALGIFDEVATKIVKGENVGQTHAMVATGNADVGFVALSYVRSSRNRQPGSRWLVPSELYPAISQDAVLLEHGKENRAAHDFLEFLGAPETREFIASFGYTMTAKSTPRVGLSGNPNRNETIVTVTANGLEAIP